MKHVRAQIRAAASAAITDASAVTTVYQSRTSPVERDKLPAAIVWLQDEDAENVTQGADPTQWRTATLQVQLLVKATDPDDPAEAFDELADAAALKVEQAIAGTGRFGGLAMSVAYAGMSSEYSEEQREGSLMLSWTVRYSTKSTTPYQTN